MVMGRGISEDFLEMVRTGMFIGEMDVALCDLCAAQARTPHFVPKESRTREWTCLPLSPTGRWGGRLPQA